MELEESEHAVGCLNHGSHLPGLHIRRTVQIIGRDEALLGDLSDQLEPEDEKLSAHDIDGEILALHARWHRLLRKIIKDKIDRAA